VTEDVDLSTEALQLATVDPGRARRLAEDAERSARAKGDWASVSRAYRAAGVASMQLRALSDAVGELHESIAAGRQARSSTLVAEARMSLASALALRGAPQQAFEAIDAALRDLHGLPAARARVQRSAILQELGRLDDALDDLRVALPGLRRAHDAQWEVRALSNRSLIWTARRSFAAAEADLVRAMRLCHEHQLGLAGAYVEQNLGCLYADRGDFPTALAHLDAAQGTYEDLGVQVSSLLIDRARVLLSVRLLEEAREASEAAVSACRAQRRWMQLPEANLLVSTVALLQGDSQAALVHARNAERSFSRMGRAEWLTLARHAHLQALVARDVRGVSPARARGSAEELARSGWALPSIEARILAGRLELRRGRSAQAQRDLQVAGRGRRSGPADVRVRAWLAEALLRRAQGRDRGAVRALEAGLRVLQEHQATLGATELRAHISTHRGELARTGLRWALDEQNLSAIHWWAERSRASVALMRPARPPEDELLAGALEDLRTTMTEIDAARGTGSSTRALVQRQVGLEQRIRDHCRRSPGIAGVAGEPPPPLEELASSLGPAALVEFIELDAALHCLVTTDASTTLHRVADPEPVRQALVHVPFALHRLASGSTRPKQVDAARAVLRRAAVSLDEALLQPCRREVADRPLVIIPTGWLQSVPWSILPSCAGRPVTVAPSATLWRRAVRRTPAAAGGVLVVAGPGLPDAVREAAAVAAVHPGSTLLGPDQARAAAFRRGMDGALLTHVAAHGVFRADNPLFSSLLLSDGPFTVHDIERLDNTPHHVVLAACETGRSRVLAGDETLGLASALLSQETSSIVAPIITIPDGETVELMATYHRCLRAGSAPADALAEAQQRHRGDGPRDSIASAGFICLGAGSRPLWAPAPPPTAGADAAGSGGPL
jgi:CHAT domain-containing protein/tetratricopeptide (TPR) repeat protein